MHQVITVFYCTFFSSKNIFSFWPLDIQSIPVLASAQVSADLSNTLETLHREAERIKIARLNCFKQSGLDNDEYKDALSALLDFKDIYDDISQL